MFYYEAARREEPNESAKERARRINETKYLDALRGGGLNVRAGRLKARPLQVKGPMKMVIHEVAAQLGQPELVELMTSKLRKLQQADPLMQQKGVDTLIVLDLLTLAQEHEDHISVLLSGDADFCPVIPAVHDLGGRVFLWAVPGSHPGIAKELDELTDGLLACHENAFRDAYTFR